eukprot:m.48526 g.48526  ORF g.48526 m.48526 type:complete len:279 (+) comp20770_c1_seq1:263-1099(+)
MLPSLQMISKILTAFNTTRLRSVVWVVPCTIYKTGAEAWALMKLFIELVGSLPIVAIFNPGSEKNSCVKDQNGFQEMAMDHAIKIEEIIEFKDFNLDTFHEHYAESYQVILPPPSDLKSALEANDPKILGDRLEAYRKLECDKLDGRLDSITFELKRNRESTKSEDSIPKCSILSENCRDIKIPKYEDCTREYCVRNEFNCALLGFLWCTERCAEYKVKNDTGCDRTNKRLDKTYNEDRENCFRDAEKKKRTVIINEKTILLSSMPKIMDSRKNASPW